MSTTSNSPAGSDAGSRFTVEDAGSTTDAADLVEDHPSPRASDPGSDPGAPSAPGAPEPPSAPTGTAGATDDFAIGHVFDQTNGVVDGLDGDSDGSAESDVLSSAERADENPAFESFADAEVQPQDGVDDSRTTGN